MKTREEIRDEREDREQRIAFVSELIRKGGSYEPLPPRQPVASVAEPRPLTNCGRCQGYGTAERVLMPIEGVAAEYAAWQRGEISYLELVKRVTIQETCPRCKGSGFTFAARGLPVFKGETL